MDRAQGVVISKEKQITAWNFDEIEGREKRSWANEAGRSSYL